MKTQNSLSVLDKFFGLTESDSNIKTEILAGLTTFFAMSYIIFVNPMMLAETGMKWGAVFIATIISAIIGTLIMGLVAKVPYAQAPGIGLSAFFVYTVCNTDALGFTWQQALSMVFICGVINILITVTKIRKYIIKAIPLSLQNAIGGGISLFIAYIGFLNVDFIDLSTGSPALATFNNPTLWLFIIGLIITAVLMIMNVKGAMFIAIITTTLIGIPLGETVITQESIDFVSACKELPSTFLVIFQKEGIVSLFTDMSKLPLVLITIFSFSISDTFDTIGTFIGTGRRTGIFSAEEEDTAASQSGFKTRLDKALFADSIATSIGALIGTSNTTTYVESAAGIAVGGRTGLTSVITAICFAFSAFFASIISVVPSAATAPILVMVGVLMASSFKDINWNEFDEALPAFFAGLFMALCYSISYGIAAGFIFYCLVKVCKKEMEDIHPILWVCTGLFVLNFVLLAFL